MTKQIDDPALLFEHFENADEDEAEQIKTFFLDNLRSLAGDSWLLNGLIDYYLQTGSSRCLQILLSCHEANVKVLLDRLRELLASSADRSRALTLIGYYVRSGPIWLARLIETGHLVKDLCKIIKCDDDLQCAISATLILTALLPMFPLALLAHMNTLFQVLSRLMQTVARGVVASPSSSSAVASSSSSCPCCSPLHLRAAASSYFVRLYALYPCNVLAFLRQHYGPGGVEPSAVFSHALRPLLDHVRMHPLLVTGSNTTEVCAERWQHKQTHDIIAECVHFSLDALDTSVPGSCQLPHHQLPEESTAGGSDVLGSLDVGLSGLSSAGLQHQHDLLWSPALSFNKSRSNVTSSASPTFPQQQRVPATLPTTKTASGGTGPEPAEEATPETTPLPSSPPFLSFAASTSVPASPKKRLMTFRFGDGKPAGSGSGLPTRLAQALLERSQCADGAESAAAVAAPPSTRRRMTADSALHSVMAKLRDRRVTLTGANRVKGAASPVAPAPLPDVSVPAGRGAIVAAPSRPIAIPSCSSGGALDSVGFEDAAMSAVALLPADDDVDAAVGSLEDQEVGRLTASSSLIELGTSAGGALTPFAFTTAQLTEHHQQQQLTEHHQQQQLSREICDGADCGVSCSLADGEAESEEQLSRSSPSLPQASPPLASSVPHTLVTSSTAVLRMRNCRRPRSCPPPVRSHRRSRNHAAESGSAADRIGVPLCRRTWQDSAAQTDDLTPFPPAPYEHLFNAVLPPRPPKVSASPHQQLLNETAAAAAGGSCSGGVQLMRQLVAYERHKRDLYADRNRRLFDRCRHTRRLEEANHHLSRQVSALTLDVAEWQRQLQLVRQRSERCQAEHLATLQRLEITADQAEQERCRFQEQLSVERDRYQQLSGQLLSERDQLQLARSRLLEVEQRLSCRREEAAVRVALEQRTQELERQLLLAVGSQRRPRQDSAGPHEPTPESGDNTAVDHQPAAAHFSAPCWDDALRSTAGPNPSASVAPIQDLSVESLRRELQQRDRVLEEQRALITRISSQHNLRVKAMEMRYAGTREHLRALELRVLSLSASSGQTAPPIGVDRTSTTPSIAVGCTNGGDAPPSVAAVGQLPEDHPEQLVDLRAALEDVS